MAFSLEALADGKQEIDILEVGVVCGVIIAPGDNHHSVNELFSNKATLVASAAVTQITFSYYIRLGAKMYFDMNHVVNFI